MQEKQSLATRTRGWFTTGKPRKAVTWEAHWEAEGSHQLSRYRIKVSVWLGRYIATWFCDLAKPRDQVTNLPCLAKTDILHSLLTLLYIHPYTHHIERVFKENSVRENLREIQDWFIPNLHLNRLYKFLYSLPLHCHTLERSFTKSLSHYTHVCEKVYLVLREAIWKEPIYIGWCYGQVAESGKLKKK